MNGKLLCAVAAAGLFASPAVADTITLDGTVRDFKVSHPDMQHSKKSFGVKTGLVEAQLGADGKPVLDTSKDPARGMISGADSFNQWFNDVPGVNIAIPLSITLDNGMDGPGGVYTFAVEKPNYFFPIDGQGWQDTAKDKNGNARNFYFTYEIKTQFLYTDPADRDYDMVFSFTGDDDVWVFINGKLAVDIGGVHGQAKDSVNLDNEAANLGLEPGGVYSLDFFFAERHTTESNFRIETNLIFTEVSPLYD